MKIQLKYILFFATPLLFFFTKCKKYPEDGKFPWQTVNARLTNHSWFIKEFIVNGMDSTYNTFTHQHQTTNPAIDSWIYYQTRFDFSLTKEQVTGKGNNFFAVTQNNLIFSSPAYWNLKSNGDKIEIVAYFFASAYDWQLFNCETDIWNIKKLTDKEFIIENTSILGKSYRVKFQNR